MLKINSTVNLPYLNTNLIKTKNACISVAAISLNYLLYVVTPTKLGYDSYNNIHTSKAFTYLQWKSYKNYIVNSFIVVWTRVIFKGKGYRIRNFKLNNKLTFNFGHSHWTKIKFIKYWFFFKRKRQNYLIFTLYNRDMLKFRQELPHIRLLNRYTKRGLRLKIQCIVRRFGKISQYISSLH